MATKSPETFVDDLPESNDDDLKIPEEFTGDNITSSDATTINTTLSLDDLNSIPFDDVRDEQVLAAMNPPTGDWNKESTWEMNIYVYNGDSQPGDINSSGRTFLSFIGSPEPRTANGQEYQPKLRLRISPDIRYKQDEPNKIDGASKLFIEARELYLSKYGEKSKNLGQVVKMLINDEYVVRTMKADNGPLIIQLKDKRKAR